MSLQQNINISMNVASAITEAENLADTLDKLGGAFNELKGITKKFDEAGNAVGATLKGVSKNGAEVSRTFAIDSAGVATLVGESIKKMENQVKTSSATVANIMRKELGSITRSQQYANSTIAEKMDFKNKAVELKAAIEKLSTTASSELNLMNRNIDNNIVGMYSKPVQDIQTKILKLRDSMRELGTEAKDTNAKIQAQLAGGRNRNAVSGFLTGNIPSAVGTSAKEYAAVNNAIAKVVALTEQHRIQVGQVDAMWKNVAAGGVKVYSSQEMSKLQAALQQAKGAFDAMGTSAAKAGRTVHQVADAGKELNKWFNGPGLVRFFEAREAFNFYSMVKTAFTEGYNNAVKLEEQIAKIQTLTKDTSSVKQWSESIGRISSATGLSSLDVAGSYYEALSNQVGNTREELESFTKASVVFAKTTGATAMQANQLLSAVINAYGMSVSDTTRISAQLFKAIDLGRISVSELANSAGRTTVPASQLGVEFKELLGVLDVLTIQGVKTSDAQTQLGNVMNKLIKPTEEMTAFLTKLGFSSGEQAVKVMTLTGVLAELRKEYDRGGMKELAPIYNEIRGFRGAIGVLGDFNKYLDYVKQIGDAEEEYARASKLVFDNNATNIQRNIENINNYFISRGRNILNGLLNIGEAFGERGNGLAAVVKKSAEVMVGLLAGVAFGTVARGAVFLAGSIRTVAVSLGIMRTAAAGAAVATTGLSAALAINPVTAWVTVLGLAASAVTYFFLTHKNGTDRYVEEVERIKEATQSQLDDTILNNNKYASMLSDNMTAGLRGVQERIRVGIQQLEVQFTELGERTRGLRANMMVGFESDMSLVNAAISQTKSEGEKAQRAADKATDQLKVLREQYKDSDFRDKLDASSPKERLGLLSAQFKSLINSANNETDPVVALEQLREAGKIQRDAESENKRNINDRKRLTEELAQKQKQLTNEQIALARRLREIDQAGGGNRLRERADAVNDALVKQKETQQEIYELEKKRAELPDKYDFKGARQAEIAAHEKIRNLQLQEAEAKKQSTELRLIEQEALQKQANAVKDIISQQVKGDLKGFEAYKNADGAYKSVADYSDGLAKQLADYNNLLERAGVSEEQRKFAIAANTAMIETLVKTYQIVTTKEAGSKKIDELSKVAEVFKERVTTLSSNKSKFDTQIRDADAAIKAPGVPSGRVADALKLLQTAKTADDAMKAQLSLLPANEAERRMYNSRGSAAVLPGQSSTIQNNSVSNEVLSKIFDAAEQKINALQGIESVNNQYREMIAASVKEFGFDITRDMAAKIENTNAIMSNTMAMQDLTARFSGSGIDISKPQMRASGGRIHGSDTVNAMLSPGEYVMNRQATRQFSSQISSMNSGMWKFGADRGSNVSVGDVNVNINSSGNSSVDAVQIGKMIQREVRRGMVKIS